tara:strand:+ start:84 stop:437 length:354 start_codon:yes stop_codon:yes gene_type:complete
MATELWSVGLILLTSLVGSLGPIYLKKASGNFSLNPLKIIKNSNLVIGFIFYALGTILFIVALRGGELTVLYPLVSTTYIWVSLWSVKMLHEKMNTYKWIGIFIIILGVSLIGFGSV